ncbi:MAG TPA: sigma 54-interacting transcriptional regulator [Thermodesulfobacteriota bacterium]|nr:sigma 54-interacting transcriptional regulator [Thermodesulfobacteriota bacterium]
MNYQDLLHSRIIPPQIVPLIERASQNNVPVLVQGEQGIGKEAVAKAIHQSSEWKYHRFYKIDCKMLKEGTLHPQLGRLFKEIQYGAVPATLFLKEVGYLSPGDQTKLLELLEEGVFKHNSEKRMVKGLRWIASASESLKEKVMQGKFSEDLHDQFTTFSIFIPPLRDRSKDIPIIAQSLLTEYATRMNLKKKGISKNVLSLLQSYWWPGTLKELETVILRSTIFSEGETLMEKDLFFNAENERNSFFTFLKRTDFKNPFETNGDQSVREQQSLPWIFFLAELVHRIKNPLVSIKTFTQLLREKFSDGEYRESFYQVVSEDIDKIDGVLNGLLNYIKVNTPLNKTNTIHQILEEVLKRYGAAFEEKEIKIFKKFEKDLPETMVHDEQLRYIFHSLLQYVLPSLPPHGSIGFLTKWVAAPKRLKKEELPSEKEGESIEILMIFTGFKRPMDAYETVFGLSSIQPEETVELELRLVHEILKRHRGTMRIEVNEKKPRTLISVRLPIERRRVIYYPSTTV